MEEIEDFTPSGLTITELTTSFLIMRDQVAELTARAERTEKQLDVYQNEIVPGFRDRAENAEAEATRLDNALHQQTNRALQAEAREKTLLKALDVAYPLLTGKLNDLKKNREHKAVEILEPIVEQVFKALTMDGESQPPIVCRYCGKSFNSVGNTDKYEHNWVKCKDMQSKLCHTCRYNNKKCETILDCVNGSGWKEIVRVEAKK